MLVCKFFFDFYRINKHLKKSMKYLFIFKYLLLFFFICTKNNCFAASLTKNNKTKLINTILNNPKKEIKIEKEIKKEKDIKKELIEETIEIDADADVKDNEMNENKKDNLTKTEKEKKIKKEIDLRIENFDNDDDDDDYYEEDDEESHENSKFVVF